MWFVRISISVIVVLWAHPSSAQDRVLGLLALPGIFGEGPCDRFEPRALTLYADAGATRVIGTLEVDQNWSFAPHGGCEGLEVSVHEGQARSELPTREYEYEAPAAIVVDRRGELFKIRLSGGRSAWISSPPSRFMSYESLLEEFTGVTFFTDAFDGQLRNAPGLTVANRPTAGGKPGQPARIIETRRSADRLWLHVEVLNHSLCDAGAQGPPVTIARGWLLAHAADGEPAVWFSSRGC
jgi:hypothetical protein